ncbi:OmpA family protein [Flaviaesturariibacter aridisoli]|uniref:OmpA family protein n=1 Tax=Flaviaesturariibacter aridisoli TaxID=2545761 RepID=A0A4R4DW08_9BACT|nr:OmpA family protein [Flaviaesturariibacter aridisoli]TCZ67738.1 OmpA family protein [Flaviaesturariibacter aridisoli]
MKQTYRVLTGLLFVLFAAQPAPAQILKRIADKAKAKTVQRVDNQIDKAIDKSLDSVEQTVAGNPDGGSVATPAGARADEATGSTPEKSAPRGNSLKAYSRFDFVPGSKILYVEDFAAESIGEMPAKWRTSGSGEVMTIDGIAGKWLNLKERTSYTSSFHTALQENYTLEFDLIAHFKDDQRVPIVQVWLVHPISPVNAAGVATYQSGIALDLKPNIGSNTTPDGVLLNTYNSKGSVYFSGDGVRHSVFNDFNKQATPVHVALWVQGTRVRAWLNQQKVYDNPGALEAGTSPSQLRFELDSYGGPQENYQYYLSNIKIAAAAADTRNKLLSTGSFSTTGILFDVNSDAIKPVSAGVLKEVAAVLNANPGVKVKIIGHTDNDGDAAANLDLSRRRAAAVKNALVSTFNVDAARIQTDGQGATKPVADNKTAEGKAQNRRVEFVKL